MSALKRVVLVTGCTGMAGTRVLEQMVALTLASRRAGRPLPFTLRAAVRDPSSAIFPDGMKGVESKRLDMLDSATYGEALEQVERVFVLFHPMFSKAIPGFLDACREARVRHVVMMTVMHADSMTALPHHTAEKQLIAACAGDSGAIKEVVPVAHTDTPSATLALWEGEDLSIHHAAVTTLSDEDRAAPAAAAAMGEAAPRSYAAAAAAAAPAESHKPGEADASAEASAPASDPGMTYTAVRPAWFMENLTRPGIHLPDIREHSQLYMPAGDGRVHLVHGSDVGEVIARLCLNNPEGPRPLPDHLGKAYALTGTQLLTFSEIAERMTAVVGRPITYVKAWAIPFMWHMMRTRGHSFFFATLMAVEYSYLISGGRSTTMSPAVRNLTGGRDPRTIEMFLDENKAAFAPLPVR
ncbi:hypothetical protein FNF27_05758 [Cafeteria roenbergensis]|uniref:NAD(P)-binding domain-containing protein n=1 Tax=Cafeteria roenbergensis TaxID=33653 RepID=A0A5A8E628_CAFRO|nr:hypothetical protein FNF27_05758 [Cafeteria roenbergensis]